MTQYLTGKTYRVFACGGGQSQMIQYRLVSEHDTVRKAMEAAVALHVGRAADKNHTHTNVYADNDLYRDLR